MLEPFKPKFPLARSLNRVPFILQIVAGMILGILIALIYPHDHNILPMIGSLFVKGLKSVAPFLVFVLVSAAIPIQHKANHHALYREHALRFVAGPVHELHFPKCIHRAASR